MSQTRGLDEGGGEKAPGLLLQCASSLPTSFLLAESFEEEKASWSQTAGLEVFLFNARCLQLPVSRWRLRC